MRRRLLWGLLVSAVVGTGGYREATRPDVIIGPGPPDNKPIAAVGPPAGPPVITYPCLATVALETYQAEARTRRAVGTRALTLDHEPRVGERLIGVAKGREPVVESVAKDGDRWTLALAGETDASYGLGVMQWPYGEGWRWEYP